MNRVSTLIVGALFAVAAVEFGLLGASASGLTGGSDDELPPVSERIGIEATPTPWATATPVSYQTVTPIPCPADAFCPTPLPGPPSPPQLSPPSVDAIGVDIRAYPLAIACDGREWSRVTVRLYDAFDNPVPDGTQLYFSAINGEADPWPANTSNGYAETNVRFYGDIFPYGPNLLVESGLLQAGIRIRCTPQSDGACPPTWPESPPPSPACEEPPLSPPEPPTPYPCNPSPGSGQLSPPCEPAPPCADSPPSASPPCDDSPLSPPVVSPPSTGPGPSTRTPGVTRTIAATRTRSPATAIPTRPAIVRNRCADVDNSGVVSRADVATIVREVQRRRPYNAAYDINRDGTVGARDALAALMQLGRRC